MAGRVGYFRNQGVRFSYVFCQFFVPVGLTPVERTLGGQLREVRGERYVLAQQAISSGRVIGRLWARLFAVLGRSGSLRLSARESI